MWWKRRRKIAVALTCADWRLHHHKVELNARLARLWGVHGVDLICVPGPDGLIKADRAAEWAAVVEQIKILIRVHVPKTLIVLAHQHGAGHPVGDAEHEIDSPAAAVALKQATEFTGPVRAMVAIYRSGKAWNLKSIAEY